MSHVEKLWIYNNMMVSICGIFIAAVLFIIGVCVYRQEKRSAGNILYGIFPMGVALFMVISVISINTIPTEIRQVKGTVQEKAIADNDFKIFVQDQEFILNKKDWLSVEKDDIVEMTVYEKLKQNYKTEINKVNHK